MDPQLHDAITHLISGIKTVSINIFAFVQMYMEEPIF